MAISVMRFFGIFLFFMFYEVLWGCKFPKWLIKVPGPSAILFSIFLELRCFTFYRPVDPVFIPKTRQKIQEIMRIFQEVFSFHISTFRKSKMLTFLDTTGPPTNNRFCFLFWKYPPKTMFISRRF